MQDKIDVIENKMEHYIIKTLLVLVIMFIILFVFDQASGGIVLGAIGASSFGSSVFIAFNFPELPSARARNMVGSYCIAIIIGALCHLTIPFLVSHLHISLDYSSEFAGAGAVSLTMFLMIILHIEHPPSAGLALGLVLGTWNLNIIIAIILAIIGCALLKKLLHPFLSPHKHSNEIK